MRLILLLILPTALIYSADLYYVDPILVIIFAVDGIVWIGLPLIADCLALLLVCIYLKYPIRTPLIMLGWSITLAFLEIVAIPLNTFLHDRAVENAQAYSKTINGPLEEYKQIHGVYPCSLNQIPGTLPMPRLLRRSSYWSDGVTYSLDFHTPGGLMDSWRFDDKVNKLRLSNAKADGMAIGSEISVPIQPAGHVRVNLGSRQYNLSRNGAKAPYIE